VDRTKRLRPKLPNSNEVELIVAKFGGTLLYRPSPLGSDKRVRPDAGLSQRDKIPVA